MVRTAGSGARPVWATDYDDEEEEFSEEVVSEDEYRPSKAVKYCGLVNSGYDLVNIELEYLSSRKALY